MRAILKVVMETLRFRKISCIMNMATIAQLKRKKWEKKKMTKFFRNKNENDLAFGQAKIPLVKTKGKM